MWNKRKELTDSYNILEKYILNNPKYLETNLDVDQYFRYNMIESTDANMVWELVWALDKLKLHWIKFSKVKWTRLTWWEIKKQIEAFLEINNLE